jgi:hypothetical protein
MNTQEWTSFQNCTQFLYAIEQRGITNQVLSKVYCGPTAISVLGLIRSQGQPAFDSLKVSGSLWSITVTAIGLAAILIEHEPALLSRPQSSTSRQVQ